MKTEAARNDLTDREVLEKLLPIAIRLLETDREHGDALWEIYKYLESRLEEERGYGQVFLDLKKRLKILETSIDQCVDSFNRVAKVFEPQGG